MMDIAKQIFDAKARLADLEQAAKAATCIEMGEHDWRLFGGRNCGCHKDANCSVPVNVCRRCGDYDYGQNADATDILDRCEFRTPEGGGG